MSVCKKALKWTHLCAHPQMRNCMTGFANLHHLMVMGWILEIVFGLMESNDDSTTDGADNLYQSGLAWLA